MSWTQLDKRSTPPWENSTCATAMASCWFTQSLHGTHSKRPSCFTTRSCESRTWRVHLWFWSATSVIFLLTDRFLQSRVSVWLESGTCLSSRLRRGTESMSTSPFAILCGRFDGTRLSDTDRAAAARPCTWAWVAVWAVLRAEVCERSSKRGMTEKRKKRRRAVLFVKPRQATMKVFGELCARREKRRGCWVGNPELGRGPIKLLNVRCNELCDSIWSLVVWYIATYDNGTSLLLD